MMDVSYGYHKPLCNYRQWLNQFIAEESLHDAKIDILKQRILFVDISPWINPRPVRLAAYRLNMQ